MDAFGGVCGLLRSRGNAVQEELEPCFPCAVVANRCQDVEVPASVTAQERAEIQDGSREDASLTHQQRHEQSADPSVAVEEWVDGFELSVREPGSDEDGKVGVVDEPFERCHRVLHHVRWRRDVGRRRQRGSRRADPVLRAPKLAGLLVGTTAIA